MELRVSTRMRARLDEYSTFHRTLGNEICHFVGVQLIIGGAGRLLGALTIVDLGASRITLTEPVLLRSLRFT